MDHTSCLGSLGSISNSPALDLILTSSEVVDQLQVLVTSLDNTVNHGRSSELSSNLGLLILVICISAAGNNLRFELSRVRNHGTATVLLDVSLNLG